MPYTINEITNIIVNNPNKELIMKGREQRSKLMLHLHGCGLDAAIKREKEVENVYVHQMRKNGAISNKDLMGRLLQEEDIIFSARGGSSHFNMSEAQERKMHIALDDVVYGMPLRKWMRNFGINAWRADPSGVILIEIETGKNGKPYPTYKSIEDIHDYDPNGRMLNYLCLKLTKKEIKDFGIKVTQPTGDYPNPVKNDNYDYFRFIDDAQDIIVKIEKTNLSTSDSVNGQKAIPVSDMAQPNPIKNVWGEVPAFIISDMLCFDDPQRVASPLDLVIELCDCFLYNRSVRDLQQKYHGFAKAVEPLLKCSTCEDGLVGGQPCPDCTPNGASKGIGYKLHHKLADVAKLPLNVFENASGFDIKKIFAYITPDIEGWKQQNLDLQDRESAIYYTYWGTMPQIKVQTTGGKDLKNNTDKTATQVLANMQPKYARLNMTADWAEKAENIIADFIGRFYFRGSWKGSSIAYGRNYILETPQELAQYYFDMCKNAASDIVKDEALERYLRALYQSNPIELAKNIKLIKTIPFPHATITEVEGSQYVTMEDKLAKRYGGEWARDLDDLTILETPEDKLRELLKSYVDKIKPNITIEPPKTNVAA